MNHSDRRQPEVFKPRKGLTLQPSQPTATSFPTQLLEDLEEAKEHPGFWSILQINKLIDQMKLLLRGSN